MSAPMRKIDRLNVAGAVAPMLRQRAGAGRKITVVDKDGRPVRVTDDVEVAKSLLARADVEFDVQPNKSHPLRKCKECDLPFVFVGKKGGARRLCEKCRNARVTCRECGGPVPRAAGIHAIRAGHLPRCRRCFSESGEQLAIAKGARRGVTSAAWERAAKESNCRECGRAVPLPKNVSAAWSLRKLYPNGRRCRSCGNKAQRAARKQPQKLCEQGTSPVA